MIEVEAGAKAKTETKPSPNPNRKTLIWTQDSPDTAAQPARIKRGALQKTSSMSLIRQRSTRGGLAAVLESAGSAQTAEEAAAATEAQTNTVLQKAEEEAQKQREWMEGALDRWGADLRTALDMLVASTNSIKEAHQKDFEAVKSALQEAGGGGGSRMGALQQAGEDRLSSVIDAVEAEGRMSNEAWGDTQKKLDDLQAAVEGTRSLLEHEVVRDHLASEFDARHWLSGQAADFWCKYFGRSTYSVRWQRLKVALWDGLGLGEPVGASGAAISASVHPNNTSKGNTDVSKFYANWDACLQGLCDDSGHSVSVRSLSHMLRRRTGKGGGSGVDVTSSLGDLEQALLELASKPRLKGWKKMAPAGREGGGKLRATDLARASLTPAATAQRHHPERLGSRPTTSPTHSTRTRTGNSQKRKKAQAHQQHGEEKLFPDSPELVAAGRSSSPPTLEEYSIRRPATHEASRSTPVHPDAAPANHPPASSLHHLPTPHPHTPVATHPTDMAGVVSSTASTPGPTGYAFPSPLQRSTLSPASAAASAAALIMVAGSSTPSRLPPFAGLPHPHSLPLTPIVGQRGGAGSGSGGSQQLHQGSSHLLHHHSAHAKFGVPVVVPGAARVQPPVVQRIPGQQSRPGASSQSMPSWPSSNPGYQQLPPALASLGQQQQQVYQPYRQPQQIEPINRQQQQ